MDASPQTLTVQVDIVSDVVCPWCVVGYLQLRQALDTLSGEVLPEIRWHPFELNPQMPAEGQDLREHLAGKYGASETRSTAVREQLISAGSALGFRFDYFDGMRMVNTFRAHQLLHWAQTQGLQSELQMALFTEFFSRRRDISDPDVLVATATAVGLDAATARAVLADGRYREAVRAAQHEWREREVYAVPTFVFAQQYSVPGAQDAETFVRVLRKLIASGRK